MRASKSLCILFLLPVVASAASVEQVNRAITKGVEYLKTQQKADGNIGRYQLGSTALAALALLESGVPADDPVIKKAVDIVRQRAEKHTHTYTISLMIMLLDRLGKSSDSALIKTLGERLAGGQSQNGMWHYSVPLKPRRNSQGQILGSGKGGDHSNTQFAVLGCWVARRHRARVDDALNLAADHFRDTVDANSGGWGYRNNTRATPSMTCAGLIALAIGRGTRAAKLRAVSATDVKGKGGAAKDGVGGKLEDDPVVQEAMEYVANHVEGSKNSDLYFLWSLERVAVIYGMKSFGKVDWYKYGTDILVDLQQPDGHFKGGWGPPVSTSFALLFLNRSNVAKDLTALVGGQSTLSSGENVEALKKMALNRSVDQKAGSVVTQIAETDGADKQRQMIHLLRDAKGVANSLALAKAIHQLDGDIQEEAREALADRFVRMTARTLRTKLTDDDRETRLAAVRAVMKKEAGELVPDLIDLLIDKDLFIAKASHTSLVQLTGQNFGPAANAKLIDFFVAKKAWQKWWDSRSR